MITTQPSTQMLETLWQEDHSKVQNILARGAQHVFDTLKNKDCLFTTGKKLKVCCIDGRIHPVEEHCVYVREGGSGILRTSELEYLAKRYAELARALQVNSIEVTRHENCGAEGLSGLSEAEITTYHQNLQEYLRTFLQDVEITIGRGMIDSTTTEGRDLQGLHFERVVYSTHNVVPFNPEKLSDVLPKGFVFNSECSDDAAYRKANIQVSLGIAFGPSGFGDRFTPDAPFLLIAVGNDAQSMIEAQQELAEAKQLFIQQQLEKESHLRKQESLESSIVITGFACS